MAINLSQGEWKVPFIDGKKVLIGGSFLEWNGDFNDIYSPILDTQSQRPIQIGKLPQLNEETAVQALEYARQAWNKGSGDWPQLGAPRRIEVIQNLVNELRGIRECLIDILMWEICKTREAAATEFDRTMEFIEKSIEEYRNLLHGEFFIHSQGGTYGKFLRCPMGVMLALGPSNYPFNETYTSIIPALLVGNVVILKIPSRGGLVHLVTQEIFQRLFPKGVINFISGPGKVVASAVMKTGGVDLFSFVGTSNAADILIRQHPHPHCLLLNLSLEGKNIALVTGQADLEKAVSQVALGAITYNGQRCTALKLIFVHASIEGAFLNLLTAQVKDIKVGLPWEEGVQITSVDPENKDYLIELIEDAKEKGASLISGSGSFQIGSLMEPVILFPITEEMRLWREEQFGPIVAVTTYQEISEVFDYVGESSSGLQCSLFSEDVREIDMISRVMVNVVGRVNINVQAGRSPDEFPFTGRKSSANGILSSSEALMAFSLPVVIASKEKAFPQEQLDTILQDLVE